MPRVYSPPNPAELSRTPGLPPRVQRLQLALPKGQGQPLPLPLPLPGATGPWLFTHHRHHPESTTAPEQSHRRLRVSCSKGETPIQRAASLESGQARYKAQVTDLPSARLAE